MKVFKTIFHSISKAVFIHIGVGAALLVGCTNNEYPASNDPRIRALEYKYSQMSPYEKAELDRRSSERYMTEMEARDLVEQLDRGPVHGWLK